MFRRSKQTSTEPPWVDDYLKARKKTARMSSSELLSWADQAGSEMMWYIQEYKKNGDINSILEVKHAIVQLHAVVDELYADHVARNVIV